MRRPTQAGFTLFEGLLTLAIFLLVLAMLGSALRDFSTFQKRFFRGDGERSAIPELIGDMRNEIWQATQISVPSGTLPVNQISLQRVRPDAVRDRNLRTHPTFPNLYWRTSSVPLRTVSFDFVSSSGQIRKTNGSLSVLKGGDITNFECTRSVSGSSLAFVMTISVKDGEIIREWRGQTVKSFAW